LETNTKPANKYPRLFLTQKPNRKSGKENYLYFTSGYKQNKKSGKEIIQESCSLGTAAILKIFGWLLAPDSW
jgi:hypothetical protein